MNSKLIAFGMITVLGVTGISLCIAVALPRSWGWPWFRYRTNLRWYKSSKKHLLYVIGGNTPAPAVVIHGFNYWTGRVIMRHLAAKPGGGLVKEYHAHQIVPVVFSNTLASKSTIVE